MPTPGRRRQPTTNPEFPIFYGYNSGGFIGEWIQGLVDPLLWLGSTILNFILGVF